MHELHQLLAIESFTGAGSILQAAKSQDNTQFVRPEENRVFSNGLRPIHPGEIIGEYLQDGQTAYDFARMLNQPVKLVKNILACKVLPPATFYLAIAQYFDSTLNFWLSLHNEFIEKKIKQGSTWYNQTHYLYLDVVLWENLKPVGMENID